MWMLIGGIGALALFTALLLLTLHRLAREPRPPRWGVSNVREGRCKTGLQRQENQGAAD